MSTKIRKWTLQGPSRSVYISAMAVFRGTFPQLFTVGVLSVVSFSFDNDFPQWGAADTKISVPSAENRKLPKALSLLSLEQVQISLCML